MATYWSSVGGAIVAGAVTIDNIDWSLKKSARKSETTNANSGGVATWLFTVKEYSGTFSAMWDSTAYPEAVIDVAVFVTLKMTLGGSTKFYQISAGIESLEPKVNTRTDAVMYSAGWIGNGAITNPV